MIDLSSQLKTLSPEAHQSFLKNIGYIDDLYNSLYEKRDWESFSALMGCLLLSLSYTFMHLKSELREGFVESAGPMLNATIELLTQLENQFLQTVES